MFPCAPPPPPRILPFCLFNHSRCNLEDGCSYLLISANTGVFACFLRQEDDRTCGGYDGMDDLGFSVLGCDVSL